MTGLFGSTGTENRAKEAINPTTPKAAKTKFRIPNAVIDAGRCMCFSFPVIQNQAGCSELKTEPTCIDNQLNPPTPCRGKSDRKPIHKRQSPKESLTINCRHYNLFLMMYLRPQIRGRVRTFILGVFA